MRHTWTFGTFRTDLHSSFVEADVTAAYLYGHDFVAFTGSADEFLGFVHPDDRGLANSSGLKCVSLPGHPRCLVSKPFRVRRDEDWHWIRFRSVVHDSGEVRGIVELVDEWVATVEEHRSLREQVLRAHSVELVDALAGPIAHDMSNLLTAVIPAIELAQLDRHDPLLEAALEASMSVADLARRMVDVVRDDTEMRAMDICRLALGATTLMRRSAPPSVELTLHLPEDALWAQATPSIVLNALVNLVKNAIEAGENKGHVQVTVAERPTSVVIEVADDGPGFAPEVISQLGRLFNSTKGAKGTGLGLAHTMERLALVGGDLRVHSKPGHTVVEIVLLRAPSPKTKCTSLPPGRWGEPRMAVLVCNVPSTLRVLDALLGAVGFSLYEAKSPGAAWRAKEVYPDAVFIVDQEFHGCFGETPPERKIQLGGSETDLPKPFSREDLLRIVWTKVALEE